MSDTNPTGPFKSFDEAADWAARQQRESLGLAPQPPRKRFFWFPAYRNDCLKPDAMNCVNIYDITYIEHDANLSRISVYTGNNRELRMDDPHATQLLAILREM